MESEIRKGKRTLKLSNLDKPFWPDEGITKGDLLSYYRSVADSVVPHLKDRPFTMKRYPDGAYGKSFFQKDAPKHMPDWVKSVEITVTTRDKPRERRKIRAPLVNDELALLWMVNMGCIDLNTWYSRVDKPEGPTSSSSTSTRPTMWASRRPCRSRCSSSRRSTPSGSRATRRRAGQTGSTSSCRSLGVTRTTRRGSSRRSSRRRLPAPTTGSSRPSGSGGSAAASSSTRTRTARGRRSPRCTRCGRKGAPVSTPLRWDEVNEKLDPASFTMEVVLERIRKHGDLFEPVLHGRQSDRRAGVGTREPGRLRQVTTCYKCPERLLKRPEAPSNNLLLGVLDGDRDRGALLGQQARRPRR